MIEGGVEKHCEALYPKLNDDIDITVYRRKPYVQSNGDYKHISFIDLPSTKIKGFEPFFHSFISSLNVLLKNADVVHYHNIGPALFSPIVKLRKIPVVLTFHSPNYEHDKWNWFEKILLKFSEKVALKTADRSIFVNKFQMEKYGDDIRKKSVYMPNGINGKYILSVGRITKEKGFDVLIKAFKLAQKNGFKLVIAGGVEFESGYMKELQELSKEEDVIFTGYTYGDNLHQLYTHAGLYVLASRNEGFPLVLLEAMKYGLDVLVADIPATHLVNLDEDDYFECENSVMLAEKISARVVDSKKRQYDLSQYNWERIAKEMSSIFYEVVGE